MQPPPPIQLNSTSSNKEKSNDLEMPLVEHLEELRQRVLKSLLALVLAAAGSLLLVKPLVRLLEVPAGSIHFLQLSPGEFLFVSIKVAGYAGLTLALPYVLYQGLAFVLPGLTNKERRLIAPAVAGSAILFMVISSPDPRFNGLVIFFVLLNLFLIFFQTLRLGM